MLERHAESLVAAFYRHLLQFPETRRLLGETRVRDHLLDEQRAYLLGLSHPALDADYVASRQRIGSVHVRVGLEPRFYLGAYALYLSLLIPLACEEADGDTHLAARSVAALQKLLLFDAHLAMDRYIQLREASLEETNLALQRSRHELARDLEETGVELRHTVERARSAERLASIGTLVAGLAHEIGTPLGVIQGHARLLESSVAGDDGRWRLRTIQEQIGRIGRILQSLLGMARPKRPSSQPVALQPLIENTLAFLQEKLARRHVTVSTDFDDAPSVEGDPERLQQLFLNLFLNACDAMRDHGGALRVVLRRRGAADVEVRIADTGSGIPADALPQIFEPFFTTKGAGEGHGLGLAVAHGIVADHGGLMEVASTGPAGTEFRIVLPAATAPN